MTPNTQSGNRRRSRTSPRSFASSTPPASNRTIDRYTNAAGRLSGSQSAASNFKLTNADSNAKGIVTDGTSLWTVDDGTTDKVFKYTLSGGLLGSWTIAAANAHPTGLTINPANVSDIWIVDNVTLKVYQYAAAAGRTSGSQAASATFALNPNNTNPQDIADPPIGIGQSIAPMAVHGRWNVGRLRSNASPILAAALSIDPAGFNIGSIEQSPASVSSWTKPSESRQSMTHARKDQGRENLPISVLHNGVRAAVSGLGQRSDQPRYHLVVDVSDDVLASYTSHGEV